MLYEKADTAERKAPHRHEVSERSAPHKHRTVPYVAYIVTKAYWNKMSRHTMNAKKLGCSGAVIDSHWILTAAHCLHAQYLYNELNQASDGRFKNIKLKIKVIAGPESVRANSARNTDRHKLTEADVFLHPTAVSYRGRADVLGDYGSDVALLRVHKGLAQSTSTIPLLNGVLPSLPPKRTCYKIGFRRRKRTTRLESVPLRVPLGGGELCEGLSLADTLSAYPQCVGGVRGRGEPCQQSSGSPLVCRLTDNTPVVVGINHGCSSALHYVSTALLQEWIEDVTRAKDLSFVPYT